MPEVHAKLSASGAKRWLACPKSVALESYFPEVRTDYAEEGTKAHAYGEWFLNKYIEYGTLEVKEVFDKSVALKNEDPEMHANVTAYVEYCIDKYLERSMQYGNAIMLVEERLDFSNIVPGGFGTGDCLIISNNTLDIIDLKYGKGVPVSAEENPQLRLYAVGALNDLECIYGNLENISTTIFQPRLKSIETEVLLKDELLLWAKDYVAPKAKMADKNKGSYNPGEEQCKFCKAKATCRARANKILSSIQKILNL